MLGSLIFGLGTGCVEELFGAGGGKTGIFVPFIAVLTEIVSKL